MQICFLLELSIFTHSAILYYRLLVISFNQVIPVYLNVYSKDDLSASAVATFSKLTVFQAQYLLHI